jgi:serine/threonine protein kinase
MRILPSDDRGDTTKPPKSPVEGDPDETRLAKPGGEEQDIAARETVAAGRVRDEDADEPLKRFGKYTIVGELGRGGMAVVYEAKDEVLSRRVALKLLPLQYSADPEFVKRFHREAQAAAVLEHPAIISIYDLGSEGGTHFIAMELVEGESLHNLLKEEDMDERKILEICAQVADGLAYAHANGIVHRDIKPSNIMVDRSGRARITDFGLARPEEAAKLTATGDVLGSPAYMSPEQARGDRMDYKTDIYSLGTVLYELLCGRPPFEAETTLELLKLVSDGIPSRPRRLKSKMSRRLVAIIMKAMERNAKDRYQDAARLAADLRAYLQGEPISARPPRLFERIDRFGKRHKVLLTFVATCSMAITVSVHFVSRYVARIRQRGAISVAEHIGTARRLTGREDITLFSFADSLLAKGDHEHALSEYERILKGRIEPANLAYGQLMMGRCREAMGDPAEAAELYRRSSETAGRDLPELRCRALYALHRMDAQAGNVSGARKYAMAMHEESLDAPEVPAPAILLRNMAVDLRGKRKFDEAIAIYEDASRTAKTKWRSERIALEIARTRAEKGDSKAASSGLRSLAEKAESADIRGTAAADAMLVLLSKGAAGEARAVASAFLKDGDARNGVAHAALVASLMTPPGITNEDFEPRLETLPKDRQNDAVLAMALLKLGAGAKDEAKSLLRRCAESGSGIEWPSRLAASKLKDLQ